MLRRNPTLSRLKGGYLFPEIEKRTQAFLKCNPDAKLISLGIGDTTLPLPPLIAEAMARKALELATVQGYRGYGPEEGLQELREAIAHTLYGDSFSFEEIFISDGAGSDIGRLQAFLGGGLKVALQDPVYPVFLDGSLIFDAQEVRFLPCLPENNFFPDLSRAQGCDVLYFCSPNNPTGAALSYEEMKELISFARRNRSLIVFDAAYVPFVQRSGFPRTIYDVEGASEVAIEVNSFSKLVGFTGVRLGWTVVPKALSYRGGEKIHADWRRFIQTFFNGASRLAQAGGLAALTPLGRAASQKNMTYYLKNAALLKEGLQKVVARVYGGEHSPYLWAHFPKKKAWDLFEEFLTQFHLVTIPGSGFGPSGEEFLRLSAFGSRDSVREARARFDR